MRKKVSERLKLKCFQKPITGQGSTSDQPTTLTEHDEGTSTQGTSAYGPDLKLGVCTRSLKSWKKRNDR